VLGDCNFQLTTHRRLTIILRQAALCCLAALGPAGARSVNEDLIMPNAIEVIVMRLTRWFDWNFRANFRPSKNV
jgi:hypothetical protein